MKKKLFVSLVFLTSFYVCGQLCLRRTTCISLLFAEKLKETPVLSPASNKAKEVALKASKEGKISLSENKSPGKVIEKNESHSTEKLKESSLVPPTHNKTKEITLNPPKKNTLASPENGKSEGVCYKKLLLWLKNNKTLLLGLAPFLLAFFPKETLINTRRSIFDGKELKRERGLDLLDALEKKDSERIRKLLLKSDKFFRGINLNLTNNNGNTTIMLAILADYTDTAKELIDNGVDIRTENQRGETALILATQKNNIEVVKHLINKGLDVDSKAFHKNTILTWAVDKSYKDIVVLLLGKHAGVNRKDENGNIPLLLATKKNYEDIVKLLLENGADVNQHNYEGLTPLMQAAANGNKSIVEILLNNGAEINTTSSSGCTALTLAAYNGQKDTVKVLLNHNMIKIDVKDNKGKTPLMLAAHRGFKDIVEMLLNNGASIEEKDNHGRTALICAISHKHYKQDEIIATLKTLIEKSANINASDDDGITALEMVTEFNLPSVESFIKEVAKTGN